MTLHKLTSGAVTAAMFAAAVSLQTYAAGPISVTFKPGWDASQWVFLKETREKRLGAWKQGPTYVENAVPKETAAKDMMPGKGAVGACWAVLKGMAFQDGIIEATVSWEKHSGCCAILCRTSAQGHNITGTYYAVIYKKGIILWKTVPRDKPTAAGQTYKWQRLGDYKFEAKQSQPYALKLWVKSDHFKFYVDGVLRIEAHDTEHPGPGFVGVNVMEGTGRVYDFRVTRLGE